MRRGLVIVTLMTVALVACSSSSKSNSNGPATTVAPNATVATPPPASPTTPTGATVPSTPTTSPGGDLTINETAYIDSVDLAAHTVTIDPMSFLTGAAAKTAFKHDNPTAKEGPENDYYIVNTTKDHDQMPLAPNATVRLVHVAGNDHTQPVLVPESTLPGYGGLVNRPFRLVVHNGTVTGITEIFVP